MRFKLFSTFIITIFAFSCSSRETILCNRDDFFCEKEWETRIPSLSTDDLYRLDRAHNNVTGGGNRYLENEFGTRGQSAIKVLIEYNKHNDFDYYLMLSLLQSIRSESGIDSCKDPFFNEIIKMLNLRSSRLFAPGYVRKFPSNFRDYCRQSRQKIAP